MFPAAPSLAIAQPIESASRLEEVVVTARRKEESLQDVPITINAFNDEYLKEHGIQTFDNIQFHTPTMAITYNSGDTIEPMVTIRGVMPNEARLNDDPSAPLYFSDVVLTPSTGLNLSLFDIGMVQVLKGPQGTLFGRNSTAGAILINPVLPGDTFEGFVEGTVGNYDLYQVDFGIDLPLNDRLQFRLAGRAIERDGYQTNKNDLPQFAHDYGKKLWDDDSKALRLSARWQPTNDIENVTILEWGKKQALARAGKAVLTGIPSFQDSVDRNLALPDPFDVRVSVIAPEHVEQVFASNTTTWFLNDEIRIKNILGYRKIESFRKFDLDGMDATIIESRTDGTGDSTDADQLSNEFQILGSALDQKLDWVLGAYFYQMDGTSRQNSASSGGMTETAGMKSTSYALFAQATYEFDASWSLTLGARQSWDEREIDISRFTNVVGSPPNGDCSLFRPDPGCRLTDSNKFDSPTWLASLTYDFTDDVMAYASVGTGYKSGGYNARASSSAQLHPYDEETVTSYEIGLKSNWNLGAWEFRTSLSAYKMDFKDLQVTVGECIDLGGAVCTVVTTKKNAAEATYEGLELQMDILPTDALKIGLAYGYVDSEYRKWLDIDRSGNVIDRSTTIFFFQPDHELNASVRYTLPLNPSVGVISLLASASWRDDMILTVDPVVLANAAWRDDVTQDAYTLVDLRADWQGVLGSKLDVSLFVKNLNDKAYIVSASDQLKDGRNLFFTHIFGEPRTYGASIRYSF